MGWDRDNKDAQVGVVAAKTNVTPTNSSLLFDLGKTIRRYMRDDENIPRNAIDSLEEILYIRESYGWDFVVIFV